MSNMVRVALDAMGGDNAPGAVIQGALDALSERKDVSVILVGREEVIRAQLEGKTYDTHHGR